MPLYEYVCQDCEGRFEAYVRAWTDEAPCPKCQGTHVQRQLSTFAMSAGGARPERAPAPGGAGGCCGGGCGCR